MTSFPAKSADSAAKAAKTGRAPGGVPAAVDCGLPEAEKRRLALLGDREVAEIDWVPVPDLALALDVAEDEAREIVRAYALRDSPVETVTPAELAQDVNVSVRTLHNWSRRGLPGVGFRGTRAYVSPVCFQWIEQFRRQSFESATGWARQDLTARSVARHSLGFPDE